MKYYKIMVDGATVCCIRTNSLINLNNAKNILSTIGINIHYEIEKIIIVDEKEAYEYYDVIEWEEI